MAERTLVAPSAHSKLALILPHEAEFSFSVCVCTICVISHTISEKYTLQTKKNEKKCEEEQIQTLSHTVAGLVCLCVYGTVKILNLVPLLLLLVRRNFESHVSDVLLTARHSHLWAQELSTYSHTSSSGSSSADMSVNSSTLTSPEPRWVFFWVVLWLLLLLFNHWSRCMPGIYAYAHCFFLRVDLVCAYSAD